MDLSKGLIAWRVHLTGQPSIRYTEPTYTLLQHVEKGIIIDRWPANDLSAVEVLLHDIIKLGHINNAYPYNITAYKIKDRYDEFN